VIFLQYYANLDGDSSVEGYDEENDSIIVYFSDGSAYEYTRQSVGNEYLERMKRLAEQGEGLNAFIMKHAHFAYSRKLR
jgi:hypothetical protein